MAEVLSPRHFFIGKTLRLEWEPPRVERIPWEIFQGRLLDRSHTTQQQCFESWNVFLVDDQGRSAEPILSLKLDVAAGRLHVVRAVRCFAWEGYHAGSNVYLSRETRKWVRELVGTVTLNRFHDLEELTDEVVCRLFQAVVGVSRLPLTSVEAPLPAFTLGQLAYFYRPDADRAGADHGPAESPVDLVHRSLGAGLSWLEKAKLLEALLRAVSPEELGEAADRFVASWRALGHDEHEIGRLFRTVLDEVALSPYTDFVDKALAFWQVLVTKGYLAAEEYVDFLSYVLRHLGRHLTAYDLVTYHHRGANYPDALLLDASLKAYLDLAEARPALFTDTGADPEGERSRKRLRRRGLRQGWLFRRLYEGHPVPDAPTSPGENARVLPPPHRRVPEEQILQPGKRTKRLFANDPLTAYLGEQGRDLLRQSIRDLRHPRELHELGMALFLDRPLGVGKAVGEPDQTLLFSHEAFSPSTAQRQLQYLAQGLDLIPDRGEHDGYLRILQEAPAVEGVVLADVAGASRPGTVSLGDALEVADDFVLVRTTARSVHDFLVQFDFAALAERFSLTYLASHQRMLIVPGTTGRAPPQGILDVYDSQVRRRLHLRINWEEGYETRGGGEVPAGGLTLLKVWDEQDQMESLCERDLAGEKWVIRPRR
jgi:hypothetical protein